MKQLSLLFIGLCLMANTTKAQTYCTPTYNLPVSGSQCISRVQLGSMNHSITGFSSHYTDYTATYGTELAINTTYNLSITSCMGNAQLYGVYLDYNDDGDFSDANETLYSANANWGSGLTLSFDFTVPNLTPNFLTRLRIVNFDGFGTVSPCGSFSQGTTIDYYIFIAPNRYCNYGITTGCVSNRITNVNLAGTSLNNTSTCFNQGHSLFAATGSATGTVTTGSSYFLTVTSSASSIVTCFIDYNHDLLLNGPFEYTEVSTTGISGTVLITIPAEALSGPTFMRIRSRNAGSINNDVSYCDQFNDGETEDYFINVQESGRFPNIGKGGVMTACTGVFDDGSGATYNYTLNETNTWLIQPAGATSLTCSFYDVGFSSGDYAVIYNGTNELAPSLGILSGTSNTSFTASSGAMYIKMTTNGSGTPNKGFTAQYTSNAPCGSPCASNLHTNSCGLDYIGNVSLDAPGYFACDLDHFSFPCTGNAYSAIPPFYCATTYIIAGDSVDLSMSFSSSNGAAVAAWVDLNQNSVFEASERVLSNNNTSTAYESVTFLVPASAHFGEMKLRTRLRANGNIAATDACTSFSSGETEDYTLFIVSTNAGPVSSAPVAAFSANVTNIAVGGSVNFTDLSTNSPNSWAWTFTGGTPSSSTAQNPSNITYSTAGCYAVSLTASNLSGNNTSTQTCYIHVGNAATNCNELFFSEYLEGTSNNKALEIYNPTPAAVNLSAYSIELYTNGGAATTAVHNLTGILPSHEVYVLANAGAIAGILAIADTVSTVCNFNGDDALVLKNGTNAIDGIGVVGTDPGLYWPVGTGSTADNTLVRNTDVDAPTTNWTTSQTQWTASASNTITNLGQHSSVCSTFTNVLDKDASLFDVSIYPNPSNGQFTIVLPAESAEITILNTLGQQILKTETKQTTTTLQLPENGVYIAYITTKRGTITRRLIVNR